MLPDFIYMDSFSAYILFTIFLSILAFIYMRHFAKDSGYRGWRALQDGIFLAYPTLLLYLMVIDFIAVGRFDIDSIVSRIDLGTNVILVLLGVVAALHMVFEREQK